MSQAKCRSDVQGERWDWHSAHHRRLHDVMLCLLDRRHSQRVLHGDLHAGKILVTPRQQVVLLDFHGALFPAFAAQPASEQAYWQKVATFPTCTRPLTGRQSAAKRLRAAESQAAPGELTMLA